MNDDRRRFTLRSGLAGGALVALLAVSGCSTDGSSSPASAASSGPVASGFTVLAGNQSPMARATWDVGRMDPATSLDGMSLLLRTSPDQRTRGKRVLAQLQDPMSPRYHRWLSPAEVAGLFGASAADVARASAWLAGKGFTVHGPSPTRTRIFFSGTVAQLEDAFRTEMHLYEVNSEHHFALAVPPSVPSDLAPAVLGLHGVHDFKLRPLNYRGPGSPDSLFDAGDDGGGPPTEILTLAPPDFATIYDVNPLYAAGITGSGQKIAIMGEGNYFDADIANFRTTYGLDPTLLPTRDHVPLSGASKISPYAYGETILDLEWSGAVAKEASIYYVFTGDNPTYGAYDAVSWAIEEGTYPILSLSYGGCEQGLTPGEDIYLETMGDAAAMEGITVVNASGDLGPATCEFNQVEKAATQGISVSYPSSIPSFVAVGGTMLDWGDPIPEAPITSAIASASPFDTYWTCSFSSAAGCTPNGYVPESAWNETAYEISSFSYFWGASGGGVSTLFTKPYWQVGTTPSGTMRLVPDLAVSAAYAQVGYMVSQATAPPADGGPPPEALTITGGTSAAAPSFAGILGLVNHALSIQNPGSPVGLGNANPVLYAINSSTSGGPAPAFHDITTGNTYVPCKKGTPDCPTSAPYQYGYAAGPGFDMATGIGSIDANNLVTAWTALAPTSTTLSATPSGTTEGSSVALTATVSSNATATSMSGSVIFYVDTLDEAGASDLAKNVTGTITATLSGGKEGGTATASIVLPPGALNTANIVAFYGGDAHYLASWSTASSVTATSTLVVSPPSATTSPNGIVKFTTTGGVAPVQWNIISDTTCRGFGACANVESVSATDGEYQAGGKDGVTVIEALDGDGAEVRVTISVSGTPIDGGVLPPPWDGGGPEGGVPEGGTTDSGPKDSGPDMDATPDVKPPPKDAGVDARHHEDAAVHHEGGPKDSGGRDTAQPGAEPPPPPSSGCSCRAAGEPGGRSQGGAVAALLGVALLGGRRRRIARRERTLR